MSSANVHERSGCHQRRRSSRFSVRGLDLSEEIHIFNHRDHRGHGEDSERNQGGRWLEFDVALSVGSTIGSSAEFVGGRTVSRLGSGLTEVRTKVESQDRLLLEVSRFRGKHPGRQPPDVTNLRTAPVRS